MKEYLGLVPKWVWITMALILIIVPLVVALTVPVYSGLVALAAEILVIIGLIFWLRKCWAQIGDIEDPCQAVLARFGKAIEAVGSGLYFRIYPIEQFKLFPTGQYVMKFQIPEGLYSKSEKGETPQPMKVKLAFVFRWPRVDREYTFPVTEEEFKGEQERESTEQDKKGLRPGLVWGRKWGGELLKDKAFYRLPIKDLTKATVDDLGTFFEPAVLGGTRQVMSKKTHSQCRVQQPEIEEEIKIYLLSEEGNQIFECGIPKECLDIQITEIKFVEKTEEAFIAPEIAEKNAEAAVHKKTAIQRELEAYLEKKVPPEIAALIVGGTQGKGMTIEQLRDLAIYYQMWGKLPFSKKGEAETKQTKKEGS